MFKANGRNISIFRIIGVKPLFKLIIFLYRMYTRNLEGIYQGKSLKKRSLLFFAVYLQIQWNSSILPPKLRFF